MNRPGPTRVQPGGNGQEAGSRALAYSKHNVGKKRRETTMAGKADLRRSRANNLSIWLLSCTALLAVSASKSMAQSAAAEPGLEDIIVTAEKRAENVQRVPLSIFAVTGEALEAAGVTG